MNVKEIAEAINSLDEDHLGLLYDFLGEMVKIDFSIMYAKECARENVWLYTSRHGLELGPAEIEEAAETYMDLKEEAESGSYSWEDLVAEALSLLK